MRIDILTLFPEMFQNVLGESMLKIASEKELELPSAQYQRLL